MGSLKYKTKSGDSPRSKPKVFFACHPDDFSIYWETISRELFAVRDCVIFYSERDADTEAVVEAIREMKMVVVPVTERLLTRKNPAMDIYIPFAEEIHIPVLPLIQGDGLDEKYRERFGDLHYLSRSKVSDFSISYETQLSKYMNSVLVSDKQSEEIRKDFDAYMFLSYRKKDLRYAKELMRRIHSEEKFRDVAIWYDEYLIPGEDFNGAISEMLEKSDVFTLAVTPNLINENNYVKQYEYPQASDLHKRIVAAEMVSTDRKALEEQYRDIPRCIDPKGPELSAELNKAMDGLPLRQKNSSEHIFRMGLAYLTGTYVEVCHERAAMLITHAAEKGYSNAMEKLADMYLHGDGVKRSYEKAIEWQTKYADGYEKLLDAITNGKNTPEELKSEKVLQGIANNEAQALITLVEMYSESDNDKGMEAALLRLGTLCEKYPCSRKFIIVQNYFMGRMYHYKRGDYANACKWFKKGLENSEAEENGGLEENKSVFIMCSVDLANAENSFGERNEAVSVLNRALEVCDAYSEEDDMLMSKVKVLRCLGKQYAENEGPLRLSTNADLKKSEEYYAQASELYNKLTETAGDIEPSMAELEMARKELKVKQAFNEGMSDINRQNLPVMEIVRRGLELKKSLEEKMDRSPEEQAAIKAVEKLEEKAESGDPADLHDLALGYFNLAVVLRSSGSSYPAAIESCEKALDLLRGLDKAERTPNVLSELIMVNVLYGNILSKAGRQNEVEKPFKEAEGLVGPMLSLRSSQGEYERIMSLYSLMGSTRRDMGRLDAAREAYARNVEYAEKLVELDGKKSNRLKLAEAWNDLGYYKGGFRPAETDPILESHAICRELIEEYPDDRDVREKFSQTQYSLMLCNITITEAERLVDEKRKKKNRKNKGLFGRLFGRG